MKRRLLIATLLLCCSKVWAETLYVQPDQYITIQSAINDANDADTIVVSAGTYLENIDFLGKAITLRSADPNDPNVVAATIIDGSNPDDPNIASVVTFSSGEDNRSILTGLTITGGTGTWLLISWEFRGLRWNRCGGGVVCYNMSAPTITRNVFTGNLAGQGGGVYVYGDPVNPLDPSNPPVHLRPIISDNTFIDNSAIREHGFEPPDNNDPNNDHGDGGAIVAFQGCDPVITNNLIQNNHAHSYGGGIHTRQWSHGIIEKNTIIANDSTIGAGIHITYNSNTTVRGNVIEQNVCNGGGGVYIYYYSNPLVEQNLIMENKSISGSAIAVHWSSEPVIRNNIIVRNHRSAAIMCKGSAMPHILYNTITDNNVPYSDSGAIHSMTGSAPFINNNIITSTPTAFGIYAEADSIPPVIAYNNVWNNQAGSFSPVISDSNGTNGNISVDPLFVDEQNDDYHLKSTGWRWDILRNRWHFDDVTSRCIDAANPADQLANELSVVPDDPDRIWATNLRTNMGAYGTTEQASLPPYDWALRSDITNDGTVNFKDIADLDRTWLNTVQNEPTDLNRNGFVDFQDFAILAREWQKTTTWH